jgi:hypothetical protein
VNAARASIWPRACRSFRLLLLLQLLPYVAADLLHSDSTTVTNTCFLELLPAKWSWLQVPAVVGPSWGHLLLLLLLLLLQVWQWRQAVVTGQQRLNLGLELCEQCTGVGHVLPVLLLQLVQLLLRRCQLLLTLQQQLPQVWAALFLLLLLLGLLLLLIGLLVQLLLQHVDLRKVCKRSRNSSSLVTYVAENHVKLLVCYARHDLYVPWC